MAPSLDVCGVMAADPALLPVALEALLPDGPIGRPAKGRIGVCLGAGWRRDALTTHLFDKAIAALARQNIEVVMLPLPDRAEIGRCHAVRVLDETLAVHEGIPRDGLAVATQRALRAAERLAPEDRARAAEYRDVLNEVLDDLSGQLDAILSPTLPVVPPKVGQGYTRLDGMPVLSALTAETCLANLGGRPAICGPAGLLPLQLTGLAMSVRDLASFAPSLFKGIEVMR